MNPRLKTIACQMGSVTPRGAEDKQTRAVANDVKLMGVNGPEWKSPPITQDSSVEEVRCPMHAEGSVRASYQMLFLC